MNIIDFDGNEHNWPPKGCKVLNDDTRKRSSLHLRCRSLLKKIFPTRQILEEVPLPGTGGLAYDFFIPNLNVAIECQGEQHFAFNSHFHGTRGNFLRSQTNDKRKRDWSDMNNLVLLELRYDTTDEQWEEQIRTHC
jgi:hypothetical protein